MSKLIVDQIKTNERTEIKLTNDEIGTNWTHFIFRADKTYALVTFNIFVESHSQLIIPSGMQNTGNDSHIGDNHPKWLIFKAFHHRYIIHL